MQQLLSAADAARLLGVVPATVRQMERSGRLPAERTAGGMRLFRRADVERLAAEREGRRAPMTSGAADAGSGEEVGR
ncbi:MAG: helix-turn-helix domain-containing protein [Chloroflexota bacterium]|nr:helix-turn-helix domain-containing protein [Chloroflexota bacterium]